MEDKILSDENVEYIVDALNTINQFKHTAKSVSPETLHELDNTLGAAEAALRRMVAEMRLPFIGTCH